MRVSVDYDHGPTQRREQVGSTVGILSPSCTPQAAKKIVKWTAYAENIQERWRCHTLPHTARIQAVMNASRTDAKCEAKSGPPV